MVYLKAGRADVALTNSMNGLKALTRLQYEGEIIPAGPPLNQEELYHYLHRKNRYLVPQIDSIIKHMKKNGELNKMLENAKRTVLDSVY